jgi:hypothetical protein
MHSRYTNYSKNALKELQTDRQTKSTFHWSSESPSYVLYISIQHTLYRSDRYTGNTLDLYLFHVSAELKSVMTKDTLSIPH